MRWIEAHDLAQWGGTRDGQAKLPELVSRLILAVYGPAAALRFPSDDSIQHAGWDGVCDAPSIFFTPQRWPQKEIWAAQRRAEGVWREVRHPCQLARALSRRRRVAGGTRINRRPEGLRNLGQVWSEWSLATIPALSQDLIIADRDDQMISVLRWLNDTERVLSVQAEAADEAIAFLHAAVGQLPLNHRIYWESRILAAQSDDVARQLIGLGPKLIVVLNGGDPGVAAALVNDPCLRRLWLRHRVAGRRDAVAAALAPYDWART